MANLQRGEVEIEIGGKLRTMRFGFDEMAELEQRLNGRSVIRMISENNFGIWALRESLYVGLSPYLPKLTPRKISEWVQSDMSKIAYYASKVAECIAAFMPKAAEPKADDDEVETTGTPLDQAEPAKS